MGQQPGPRTATRITLRPAVVGLLVATVAIVGIFVDQSAWSSAGSPGEAHESGPPRVVSPAASSTAPTFDEIPRGDLGRAATEDGGAVTEADGALPRGATVFDDEYPGIAKLDAGLLQALRDAGREAAGDGIELTINSGWRSRNYQNALLRAAVAEYGSEKEAARWVATADTSPHVSGDAVDIGAVDAMTWLSEHGAEYGLCQIYRNEPWHFELRLHANERGCPRMYADPTHDPRMQ
jgi:zinc D-Ala-D-Ala carboxypeptidase